MARPEPPRRLRRILASRAYRYAIRVILFLLIVLAVVLLFPGHAH